MNNREFYEEWFSIPKEQMKRKMLHLLEEHGYNDIVTDEMYIIAEGDLPICLVAHMDTVFEPPLQATVKNKSIFIDAFKSVIWSPQGLGADDRAGLLMIKALLEEGFRPHIILTDFEETGGDSAYMLVTDFPQCPFAECKALIELDRQGVDDVVYYKCANGDFKQQMASYGFKEQIGSFTDIAIIAPYWNIAAANVSVGYGCEHTTNEIFSLSAWNDTFVRMKLILEDIDKWDYFAYKTIEEKDNFFYCFSCGARTPLEEMMMTSETTPEGKHFHTCVCPHCAFGNHVKIVV